jgi:hypothetical protein
VLWGTLWALSVESGVDICPVCLLGTEDDMAAPPKQLKRPNILSVALLKSERTDLYTTQRCHRQTPDSSDNRIILPFHTLSCCSLKYNCFLHNKKPAQE